jgi:Rod binding domain-containing protein
MFRPMLVQRYAEAISKAGGVGIADAVMREMLRMQGQTNAPEAADGADR